MCPAILRSEGAGAAGCGGRGASFAASSQPGVLGTILNAIEGSAERQVEREIAALIAQSGGRFTDSTEREISWRLLGMHGSNFP